MTDPAVLNRPRLIVGIVLVLIAFLIFVFAQGAYATTGAVGLGVPGLIGIAISRKNVN